ncbi:MAG TPA: hypothetical protein VET27_08745 [Mycobacterium sp.]|nr:hypothetical protein [Mycobacterium sp.]
MPGIADIALAGAPIAGGALLGVVAGNLRGPDIRALVKQDMELLKLLPPEQVERRAELQRVIDIRIDDLIAAVDKQRSMLEIAASYRGNWRDIVVFVCAILFTIIWWNTDHSRSNYWVMFVVMIVVSVAAGMYAGRGVLRAIRTYARGLRAERGQ